MQKYAVPFKRSMWSHNDEGSKFKYNPFRRRAKYSYSEQEIPSDNQGHVPPPPQKTLKRRETPSVIGPLFSPAARLPDSASSNESVAVNTSLGDSSAEKPDGVFDEEKPSMLGVATNSQPRFPSLRIFSYIYNIFASPKETSQSRGSEEYKDGNRRRRVIVVEYGNTDDLTEGILDGHSEDGLRLTTH